MIDILPILVALGAQYSLGAGWEWAPALVALSGGVWIAIYLKKEDMQSVVLQLSLILFYFIGLIL